MRRAAKESRSIFVLFGVTVIVIPLLMCPILPLSAAVLETSNDSAFSGGISPNSVASSIPQDGTVDYISLYDDDHGDDDREDRDEKDDDHDEEKKNKDRDDNRGNNEDREKDNKKDHTDDDEEPERKDKDKDNDHDDDGNEGKNDDRPGNNERDEPLAISQNVVATEDVSIQIVLDGRIDNNRDTMSFSIVNEPQHGDIQNLDETTGSVTYHPEENFFGQDTFTFTVGDGVLESEPATVTIEVSPINDAPVAIDVQVSTREGMSTSLPLAATDVDKDQLEYKITSGPTHGALAGFDTNLTYEPAKNFHGSDAITFRASDGSAESNVATVTITVESEHNDNRGGTSWWEITPTAPGASQEETPSTQESDLNSAGEVYAVGTAEDNQAHLVGSTDAVDLTGDSGSPKSPISDVSFTDVIGDVLAPMLIFPSQTPEAVASSAAGAVLTYTVKAVDDIDGEIDATCSPESGYLFHVGKFNVICSATDSAGNSALGSFVVVVHSPSAGSTLSPLLIPVAVALVLGAASYMGFRALKRIGKIR